MDDTDLDPPLQCIVVFHHVPGVPCCEEYMYTQLVLKWTIIYVLLFLLIDEIVLSNAQRHVPPLVSMMTLEAYRRKHILQGPMFMMMTPDPQLHKDLHSNKTFPGCTEAEISTFLSKFSKTTDKKGRDKHNI